ncbi:BppU family phage baseplate upper protein [Tetragenococcus halophilus]|uniref:BppU family phage baseplate upper protein n=1 Tax=Tetragenococcus halophilus TaxID=51669 RepID=UPI0030C9C5A9
MYKNQNKLYKDIVLEVDIDAKKGSKNQGKETKATFYSYDIDSGIVKMNITKDNQPLPLPNGTKVLINVVKLGLPQQKLVYNADIVDATKGITHWDIPEYLTGYKGKVRAGVFINLPNGQRLHGGYFKFNMGISEIDTNLDEFEEDYWQGWDEFQKEAESEWSDWKAIRDDTWKKQEEDYDEWKQEQENKQTDYENKTDKRWNNWRNQQEKAQSDFESNFVSWKSEQEEEQTGFESDFADWKTTQETKQTNFESETSQKITDINQTLETTDSQVQETNNALENLDAYSKQETDNKLAGKADKEEVGKTVNDIFEQGYLELEKGFENYYENDTEKTDRDSTLLKYTRVGPLLHVFGIITNTVRLEEGSSTIVTYIPDHLKVASRDVKVSQGSQNNLFTSMALSYENDRYTNAITMERLRDNTGNDTGYNSGKFLNISLTFTVEVVK